MDPYVKSDLHLLVIDLLNDAHALHVAIHAEDVTAAIDAHAAAGTTHSALRMLLTDTFLGGLTDET